MLPATILPRLRKPSQTVSFSESAGVCSAELFSSKVVVRTDAGKHNHGSSKVKLKNLVDYNWDMRYYTGQLLAVHMGGKYLAYAVKEEIERTQNKPRNVSQDATAEQKKDRLGVKIYSIAALREYSGSPYCRCPPPGLEHFPEEMIRTDAVPNNPNPSAWSGMVRVIHSTSDKRVLLKGIRGEIQDLAFAYIESQVILACIDELGHTYVFTVELVDNALRGSLVVEILNDGTPTSGRHRVVWCPYIPDEDDGDTEPEDDNARLLLSTHHNTARIWKMWGIVGCLEKGTRSVTTQSIVDTDNPNLVTVSDHTAAIVDAAFSPDGTALATASADGFVMFFQVYMHTETPRCLHRWQPHEGKPLSCLFFLDNHKNYSSDVQFWKFAVTGAERSTVIKIWCCKSWECLQTITFNPDIIPDLSVEPTCGFKAVLDSAAQYLMLSDFKRRCLYILHMGQEAGDYMAYCTSISEFLLPFPVLSFAITDAGTRTIKCSSSCGDPYHNGGGGEDGGSPTVFDHTDELTELETGHMNGTGAGEGDGEGGACGVKAQLRLYLLQPKGLQEGRLLYTPPPANGGDERRSSELEDLTMPTISPKPAAAESLEPLNANPFLQQQSQQLKNILMRARTQPGSLMGQRTDSPPCPPPAAQLNLMTPDAFSSPGKRDEEDPPISATPDPVVDPHLPALCLAKVSPPVYELEEAPPKYTSLGSSPSREVQEIFESEFLDMVETEVHCSPETACAVDPLQNGTAAYDPERLYIEAELKPPNVSNVKETIWPQITIEQINEANQRKASSDKSGNQSINNSIVNVGDLSNVELSINEEDNGSDENQIVHRMEALSLSTQDRARLDALELKLEKITDMMSEQNRLLRSIREEQTTAGDTRQTVEQALHAHTAATALSIDNAFGERWGRVEMAAADAGAAAADAVSAAMARVLDPLTRSLQHEFASRMTATDTLLRDNIEKMVHSKSIQESLGNAVARTLSGMVRDSFRDVMAQTLVPTLEKATGQIFKQVNQAFQNGTKEFVSNTEAYARAAAERGGAAAAEALRAALQRHEEVLASAASQPPPPPNAQQLTPVLHSAVRGVLEQEMSRWREQAASVLEMSRSQTPTTPRVTHTPHQVDRQRGRRMSSPQLKCYLQIKHSTRQSQFNVQQFQLAQITSLISSDDVNGAFQVALSASDLSLVVHVCRTADPAHVFSPSCRLKQHVLLSLVQQLAADMTSDTQLKHRYLEEAIINLDASNPVTREHMPIVVRELKKQLSGFLNAHPSHQLARQIKMLLMATESLLNSNTM